MHSLHAYSSLSNKESLAKRLSRCSVSLVEVPKTDLSGGSVSKLEGRKYKYFPKLPAGNLQGIYGHYDNLKLKADASDSHNVKGFYFLIRGQSLNWISFIDQNENNKLQFFLNIKH